MESALPMLLFLGFLFGFGMLILVCGFKFREEEREEEERLSLDNLTLEGNSRFFGLPGQPAIANPVAVVVDESSIRRLERFLHEEMALAEVFVEAPSAEVLHRTSAGGESNAPLFERMENYLRREHEAAASFVLNPSIESLYSPVEALVPIG